MTDFRKFTRKDFNSVKTFDDKEAHIIRIGNGDRPIEVCFEDQEGYWHFVSLRSDGVYKQSHQPLIVSTREQDKVVVPPTPQIVAKGYTLVSTKASGRNRYKGYTIYRTYEECLKHKKDHHEIKTVDL